MKTPRRREDRIRVQNVSTGDPQPGQTCWNQFWTQRGGQWV